MGSGGGGSAGKVDYPDYLKDLHHALFNNMDSDTLDVSAFDLYNEACANSPYATANSYTGRLEIGDVPLTVAQAIVDVVSPSFDPLDRFVANLTSVNGSVNNRFSLTAIENVIEQASENANVEFHKMTNTYDFLSCGTGVGFSSARVLSRPQVLDAKMRAVMSESLKELSESVLQLGHNKLSDALSVTDAQMKHFKVSRTAYTMAVEMCKLTLLNEREYFEQEEFYTKYAAHWRFECAQEVLNGIAVRMGKKLRWIESPDVPGWMADLGHIGGMLAGDFIGAQHYKRNKRFRMATMAATAGYISGGVVGAVVSGVTSYLTYREGEWR